MDVNSVALPEQYLVRLADIRAGRIAPAPVRPAATVVVMRDHPEHGLQVFMMRRVSSMEFAAGAYVFPGGSVDSRDGETGIRWAGPTPDRWGATLRADESLARELVCAAVRETFEETSVLLAGATMDTVVDDTRGDDWEADRRRLLDRSHSMAEFLERRHLVLRSDLLRPWAHWITPDIEPKRYDTRFFVAAIPPGQQAGDVSTEADQVTWVRPADAMEHARRGEWRLFPPTLATVTELAGYRSVAEVLAAPRDIVVVQPRAEIIDGKVYLVVH